jgi:RNA-directed DNA polymerase
MQHHLAGTTTSGTDGRGRLHGFKTSMPPSPTAIRRHHEALRTTIARHQHAHQETRIKALNPRVRGWSRYDAHVKSARVFQQLDPTLYARLRGWAVDRHPNQSKHWIMRQDWRVDAGQGGTFQPPPNRVRLVNQAHTLHQRHGKVQGTRSPYDGDWI